MFTSLTIEQADKICQIVDVFYHHHDSVPRKYDGYEQPYIHFYSEKYNRFVFRVGCQTGVMIFYNEERIIELEDLSEKLYQKLIDANAVIEIATEEHNKTIERREKRLKFKQAVLAYLNENICRTLVKTLE